MESKRMETARMVLSRGFFILMLLTTGVWYVLGFTGSISPPAMIVIFFAIFAAGAILLFYLLYRHGKPVSDRFLFRCCAAGFVVLLALQLAAAYYLEMTASWDPGGVFTSAKECVENHAIITHTNYFSRFQNNTGLLTIEVLYFFVLHFFGIPIEMFTASLLNIVFTDVAILFMVLFLRRTWDNNRALLYMAASVVFMPNFLYIPVMYTDTMSMVFITLTLYLFSCYLRQERRKIRIIQLVAISLLLCAGTKVKGSVAILLVALIVYLVLNSNWRRWVAGLLLLITPFTLASAGFDWSMRAVNVIRADEDLFKFPTEYWVYMGLKDEGGFNYEDFEYIYGLPDYETRQEAGRTGIAQRLSDYGLKGLLEHIGRKAKYTYGDGTYFAGVCLSREPAKSNLWHEIFTVDGQYYWLFCTVANAFHYLILILLLAGMVLSLKKRSFDLDTLLYIALFGLSVFLMIWETRSRYLLNFTPLMFALAAGNLTQIGTFIMKRIEKRKGDKL